MHFFPMHYPTGLAVALFIAALIAPFFDRYSVARPASLVLAILGLCIMLLQQQVSFSAGALTSSALVLAFLANKFQHRAARVAAAVFCAMVGLALGLHLLEFHRPFLFSDANYYTNRALNFRLGLDKALAGVIFLLLYTAYKPSVRKVATNWPQLIGLILGCTAVLIALSLALGLTDWASAFSPNMVAFAVFNLLFTCIAEEALFRGLIQRGLTKWTNSLGALLIASALFGLAHLAGGWLYAIFAGLAGLFYGEIYRRFGSLWFAVVAHWLFNLSVFCLVTING